MEDFKRSLSRDLANGEVREIAHYDSGLLAGLGRKYASTVDLGEIRSIGVEDWNLGGVPKALFLDDGNQGCVIELKNDRNIDEDIGCQVDRRACLVDQVRCLSFRSVVGVDVYEG